MSTNFADLGTAIQLASISHLGQYDKGGNPYILHPIKVMHYCKTEDPEIKMIAILHDTVEDTWVTLEYLKENGYSQRVIDGVDAMTKRDGESFEAYVQRVMENKDAIIVKMADLRHNTDVRRLKGLTEKDFKRMEKYQQFYKKLETYRLENKF